MVNSIDQEALLVSDREPPTWFNDLWSRDRKIQNSAFTAAMGATSKPVGWANGVWEVVVERLDSKDNHHRAIASQILCNLASHDPAGRVLDDLDDLIDVTRDSRFVTARHCLQSLWKVGLAGPATRQAIVEALERRYADCLNEKNATLIRSDIILGLRRLHDATGDVEIATRVRSMVESETDPKYRAKYAGHWQGVARFD